MTTSPVPLPVRARVRRRHNRRVTFVLIKRRVDVKVTDFVWHHLAAVTLVATLFAGVTIAVVARALFHLGGI